MFYTHLKNSVDPARSLEEQSIAKKEADKIGIKMYRLESENQPILTIKPKF